MVSKLLLVLISKYIYLCVIELTISIRIVNLRHISSYNQIFLRYCILF